MNKKLIAIMGVSGALMFGSVYTISAHTSGYEMYKDALKKTHDLKSSTLEFQMQLEDNGKDLLTSSTFMKTNSETELMSGSTTMSNGKESSGIEMFRQDGHFYVKDGQQLYRMSSSRKSAHLSENSQELQKDLEKLVDVLTKNLQQKIVVKDEANGYQKLELDLDKSEIPLAANIVSSLMIKHAVMMNDRQEAADSDFHHIKPELPALKKEIVIEDVKISADIHPNNYVEKQTVTASVSGTDANGKAHNLTLSFEIELSDVNKTVVEAVDISNQEIKEVKHGH
jgi:hypothetical protein